MRDARVTEKGLGRLSLLDPSPGRWKSPSVAKQPWWEKIQRTANDIGSGRWADDAREKAQQATRAAQESAAKWVLLFQQVHEDPDDADALARRFDEALETIGPQLDRACRAVSVGVIRRAGAGVSHLSGQALTYVRPEGPIRAQIRYSELSGRVAALSLGTSAGGFAACLYGERATLLDPLTYRGADAGLFLASIGVFRATGPSGTERAHGWLLGIGAGVGLGVPLVSEVSGFEWSEFRRSAQALSTAQSRPLEARLEAAPDRKVRRRAAGLAG